MKTQLQLQQVEDELAKMKLMYPHSGITGATIMATAPVYLQDCLNEGMSAKDFTEACSLARRNSPMFPSVGNIVKAHRDLMAGMKPSQSTLSLPQHISDERRDKNVNACRRILKMLKDKMASPGSKPRVENA